MLRIFKADLHIHSCLSPCGDLDMSPRGVVETALEKGLDIIAVADHNTAENVGAVIRAAKRAGGPVVICGLEISTVEEVHVLALFETLDGAVKMQEMVYGQMSRKTNRPEVFGDQVVANEDDEVEGFNDKLLIGATGYELAHLIDTIHGFQGLAVASHLDRESYSLLGQLGFVPPGLELDGYEVSKNGDPELIAAMLPDNEESPIIMNSDAHFIRDIGSGFTEFCLEKPVFGEVAMALKSLNGRKIIKLAHGSS
jgi:PHP family Zn ribbon phosphoesterase